MSLGSLEEFPCSETVSISFNIHDTTVVSHEDIWIEDSLLIVKSQNRNGFLRFYSLNTGEFMGKDIKPDDTLGVIEAVIEERAEFKPFGPISNIEVLEWPGFIPDFDDPEYVATLKARMQDRVNFIKDKNKSKGGFDKLPVDALEALENIMKELEEA